MAINVFFAGIAVENYQMARTWMIAQTLFDEHGATASFC
jgi:hypothetical protein